MSPRAVPLESIRACLAGVIPSPLATCAADGTPNISYMSIVKYVDPERVALSRQFLNKTRANLDANPVAQVLVVDPGTCEAYLLDLRHVHTETDGPVFEAMRTELEAVASQTGMGDVFRLRGADIYHVVRCEAVHDDAAPAPARPERDLIGPLDELTRRLALADSYADAATTALRSLEDLFDFPHAILLAADERGDRLFAVASNGYPRSGAGAEVAVGVGLIGIAAERRHVVSVANLGRSRTMSAAVRDSVERGGEEIAEKEIPLPGLGRAQSASAVPLVVRGRLTGLLYLESEQIGCFGPHNERLLRIVGAHLGAALSALEDDSPETAVAVSRPHAAGAAAVRTSHEPAASDACPVVYYQADDSVFVGGEYVVRGVPGRILWRLLNDHAADGRTAFTNRELRLDERLGLPAGADNLEARLLVLRRRLGVAGCGVGLERVGRGRLELRVERPLELSEIVTSGPMRAAHARPDATE